MGWTEAVEREDRYDCAVEPTGDPWWPTNVVHAAYPAAGGQDGYLKLHAPFYYAPDTTVIFTLEGVGATGVALSNLLLWGHSPIAVDETTGNVSYLLLMSGGQVYSIVESNFNHEAAISTGTNSWPYDCALMTYSNSVKSISFTGFHNENRGWTITRNGEPQADAVSSRLCTVEELAAIIHLEAAAFEKWLEPADGKPMPSATSERMPEARHFKIPNEAHITQGDCRGVPPRSTIYCTRKTCW